MSVTIEAVGGPRDGDTWRVNDFRDTWLIPKPVDGLAQLALIDRSDIAPEPTTQVGVYRAILDPAMGRPSLSDRGHHRFAWEGWR